MHDSDRLTSPDLSDADFERLLGEAYDAPAIPRSLLNRLDVAVTQQWGVSPGLVEQQPHWLSRVSRASIRSSHLLKVWPIAACLAVALAWGIAFHGNAPAYGWASIVKALGHQPVIQTDRQHPTDGVRWLSVSEKSIGEHSSASAWLLDFGEGHVLLRRQSEAAVTEVLLKQVPGQSDREQMVLTFLLGNVVKNPDVPQATNLTVLDESSSRVNDTVKSRVTFGVKGKARPVVMNFDIDPQSNRPLACEVDFGVGEGRKFDLSYPETSGAELASLTIPAGLQTVPVKGNAIAPNQAGVFAGIVEATSSASTPPSTEVAVAENAADATASSLPLAAKIGAASLPWSPLVEIDASRDDIVEKVNASLVRLWTDHGIAPAAAAGDEELLRRVHLDLVGRTPTVSEARAYLQDTSADRYAALVDRLLASRDHATHLATVWRTFLLPEGIDLTRFGGVEAFDAWLAGRFGQNNSYDKTVRELLLAEGRLTKSGPLLFYAATKLDADQLAARTARVFLGMRLECAQCHDDPFEPWTQQDFWSFAAFFARISRPQAELDAVSTVMQVRDIDRGEVMLPNSKTVVPPRFLDGSTIDLSPAGDARRRQLARWLTGPDNPYFARAAVNRVWAHLFGQGIIDPVDGFGKEHQPRSPELMDLLAAHFIRSGFDLRELFRVVALSRAYRLSSGSDLPDQQRPDWFAQMNVKTLTAEQIYDCIAVATLLEGGAANGDALSLQRVGNSTRETFLQQFRTPSGRRTEYERGIPQALTLMNGSLINGATGLAESGLLKSLEAPFFTDDQRIEVVYLATLSRRPTPAEWKLLRPYVTERGEGVTVLEPLADILWAVLNGVEFTMNH